MQVDVPAGPDGDYNGAQQDHLSETQSFEFRCGLSTWPSCQAYALLTMALLNCHALVCPLPQDASGCVFCTARQWAHAADCTADSEQKGGAKFDFATEEGQLEALAFIRDHVQQKRATWEETKSLAAASANPRKYFKEFGGVFNDGMQSNLGSFLSVATDCCCILTHFLAPQ